MKHEIHKERMWIFAPVATVATKVTIEGDVVIEELKAAIAEALEHNEILKTKVVFEGDKVYLENQEKVNCRVEETSMDWKEILQRQEKLPFDLPNGEYLRFYMIQGEKPKVTTLLLLGHYLVGDGISYSYLIQDIMRALSGERLEYKPVQLFHMADLPKSSDLNWMMYVYMNRLNKKWKKDSNQFAWKEFLDMNEKYWMKHESSVHTYRIAYDSYERLVNKAKEHDVSVNTLITTTLLQAAHTCGEREICDVGLTVGIRKKGHEGMGNFATDISIEKKYDSQGTLKENCIEVQKLIRGQLDSDKKKFFLLQFMGKITGSLMDATYFAALEGYDNKVAKSLAQMFGYDGNPKGISLTNLGKLPISNTYGTYRIKDYIFVPPLVLNSKRLLGIATLDDAMEISYVVEKKEEKDKMVEFFETAMNYLNLI